MIELRDINYIGIHKIIPRLDPYTINDRQLYSNSIGRTRVRNYPIRLDHPAYLEVHLAAKNKKEATNALTNPSTDVAVFFTIHNNGGELTCRNNTTAFLHGTEGQEALYYILRWEDVLNLHIDEPLPDNEPKKHRKARRKIRRMFNPHQHKKFHKTEKGHKVYYVNIAQPPETTLIKQLLTQ